MNILSFFRQVNRINIQIPNFRLEIVMWLTKCRNNEVRVKATVKTMPLNKKNGTIWLFYKICYEKYAKIRNVTKICDILWRKFINIIPNQERLDGEVEQEILSCNYCTMEGLDN